MPVQRLILILRDRFISSSKNCTNYDVGYRSALRDSTNYRCLRFASGLPFGTSRLDQLNYRCLRLTNSLRASIYLYGITLARLDVLDHAKEAQIVQGRPARRKGYRNVVAFSTHSSDPSRNWIGEKGYPNPAEKLSPRSLVLA